MQNPKLPETATVLFGAIKILNDEGWIRGTYHTDKGHCAAGAIYESAKRLHLESTPAISAFLKEIDLCHIPTWNDRLWRTRRSVIKVMNKAATKALVTI